MFNFIKEIIEQDATTFTYKGKELFFPNNDEANLYTLELAKKFIIKTNDKPDEDTPIEALALYKYEPSQVLQMIKDDKYPEDLKAITTNPEATEKDNKPEVTVIAEENKNNEPEINKFEVKEIHGFPTIETCSLPEESDTTDISTEEPEFEFIEGFPVASNTEPEQIQVNELKADIKAPEAIKDDSKRYLSDEFEEKDFQSWTNDKHILLIANAGAGKTSLLLDKFTNWAKEQSKSVLYLYNRKVMKAQFADNKAEEHKNLEICSYQGIEERTRGIGVQDYIDSFDYILCDECHYFVSDAAFNENTFLSYEAVNNCKGTTIYFTATPKYFLRMKDKLNKPLEVIDKTDLSKKNIQKIYLAKNLDIFNKFEAKLLEKQKVIHFENDGYKIKDRVEKYFDKGYKSEMLVSEKNKCKGFMNKKVAEQIKHSTDENGNDIANVFTDFLGCTSAYENGVNFNVEGSVTVSFAKYINWTSLEQSRSRVRNFNDNNVNMLVCIPHKAFLNKVVSKKEKLIKELKEGQKKADINVAFGGNEYNQFNDFRIAFHEIELLEVEEIINTEDKIIYYQKILQKSYPNAEIKVINYCDLTNIEDYFNNILNGSNVAIILNPQKEQIKNDLKALKLDRKNPNNPVGLKKIKDLFKEKNLPFDIDNGRATINGKQESVWILKRVS